MVAVEQPVSYPAGIITDWQAADQLLSESSRDNHYRIVAFPVGYAVADDVIIRDERGRAYLLTHDSATPSPLEQREVDALGLFYEPSQDYSWHTAPELRRIIYGIGDSR